MMAVLAKSRCLFGRSPGWQASSNGQRPIQYIDLLLVGCAKEIAGALIKITILGTFFTRLLYCRFNFLSLALQHTLLGIWSVEKTAKMSEHWDQRASSTTHSSRAKGGGWDNGQSSTPQRESRETGRHNTNAFPRLQREDSWASSISNASSVPSPRPRRSHNWDEDRSSRRNDNWDSRSVRSSRRSNNRRDERNQNEANWEKEENDEENERNWAIEERLEENERNWEAECKKEENDRLWQEAQEDHQLRDPPIRPRIVEPQERERIPRKPIATTPIPVVPISLPTPTPTPVQTSYPPVTRTDFALVSNRYTTTSGTNTDFTDDEDLPSPLRISRNESWNNSSSNAQTIPTVLRAGRGESWQDNNNAVYQTAPITMRGGSGGRDSASLDLEAPTSPLSGERGATEIQRAEAQDAGRVVSSPARLVFQFKPQRRRTGSNSPPRSSFPISPLSVTQVGSENGSVTNLNEFAQSNYSIVSIVKYHDKDIQCDFDEPPPKAKGRGLGGFGKKGPNDGSLPTGSTLAILLICTCMAIFLQALVRFAPPETMN